MPPPIEARESGAEVITHEVNRGKGAAIKTGLKTLTERGFKYIQILDGDGQHLPEEIPRFLEEANRSQSHVVLGNRMTDVETMPFVRKMTNRFMSWQISSVCGQPIPDTQCGFRMIHRDVAPLLFCETDAFDYETEMLLIASQAGFKVAAVPVSTVYGDEESKIQPRARHHPIFQAHGAVPEDQTLTVQRRGLTGRSKIRGDKPRTPYFRGPQLEVFRHLPGVFQRPVLLSGFCRAVHRLRVERSSSSSS